MFAKQKDTPSIDTSVASQTVISEGITIKDNMICGSGNVSIGGVFFGDIEVDGFLIINESGNVRGDIRAAGAHVHGSAEGNLVVHNTVRIFRGGRIFGDIHCGSFIVDEGAAFGGQCNMGAEAGQSVARVPRPSELDIITAPLPATAQQA